MTSSDWVVEGEESYDLGYFRVYVTAPGQQRTEVTLFRGFPTKVLSYASADPYGDSTCQIEFSQISILDDLGHGDLDWFQQFANIDIEIDYLDGGSDVVFEGFLITYDWSHSDNESKLTVTCQGALYQVDRYVAMPEYPSTPVANEVLIAQAFSPHLHPDLRCRALVIEWPDDWDVLAYRTGEDIAGVQAGGKATGFATRTTGGWEKALTGNISNLLSTMYTSDYADQWTIRKDPGRQPVMHIRYASRTPDFSINCGQPGVSVQLTRDYTNFTNVIYGSGSSLDGSAWTRQTVDPQTNLTGYVPMAADPRVYPDNSPSLNHSVMKSEGYVQFESGIEVSTALKTAQLMLRKNMDPGYAGQITLNIDPTEISRYLIKAGMTMKLRYFGGLGEDGINLHITQVDTNVEDGTVQLTVDSLYRDALTVAEALARTRDPLTTIKMLQVGKQSILIPDTLAPWSYAMGSGYVPKTALPFFTQDNTSGETFPFDQTAKAFPPKSNPTFYVGINAGATSRAARWAGPIPIRFAEKGTIRLTQFGLYDRDGNRVNIPFHVSLYYVAGVDSSSMPFDDNGPSPFIPGAFQSNNQYGLQIPGDTNGATALPQQSLVIGWGDGDQPAGYSPGTKTNGDPATGLLIDETSWQFDCTNNPDFQQNPSAGYTQLESAITLYAMFYAEYHDWVYAIGRFYNMPAGFNS